MKFFTVVNPMDQDYKDVQELDFTKQRLASYKQKCKRQQDAEYGADLQLAQRIEILSNKM